MPRRAEGQEGFTLVEAVLAVALLAIVGLAFFEAAGRAFSSSSRLRADSLEAAGLLKLDDGLRGLLGRVFIPAWASSTSLRSLPDGLALPYFEGEPESELRLSCRGDLLVADFPGGRRSYHGVEAPAFRPLLGPGGEAVGLRLDFLSKGRPYSILARFGSSALQGQAGLP